MTKTTAPNLVVVKRAASKYERARDTLRRKILNKEYPPGAQLPTELELPKILKVGNQTVRRALHDLVNEGLITRRRGKGTFVAEHTQPRLLRRATRIGILWKHSVIPGLVATTFQGQIVQGVLQGLGLAHIQPVWKPADADQTTCATIVSEDQHLTIDMLGQSMGEDTKHPPLQAVMDRDYDGLICISIIEEKFLTDLLGLKKPVVLLDALKESFTQGLDQVYIDPLQGYRQAVCHFAAKGMKRIHFVSGHLAKPRPLPDAPQVLKDEYDLEPWRMDPDSYLRMSAYLQAMDACGLPPRNDWLHLQTPHQRSLEQLGEMLAGLPEPPEAIISHNAGQAEHLIRTFAHKGLRLEGAGAEHSHPLASAFPIQVDPFALGTTGAELLIARMQHPERLSVRAGIPMFFSEAGTHT